ncbi:uncharacterized protein LOC107262244 [Ricinus communis]|uniref:uncharacterized protein LOC107262244 n=1 Tax=Ricinus communis TaxID=3988 RepID=UPI00201A8102|nr:uncharacterized protein LOC107262244 [Ricinus communis]
MGLQQPSGRGDREEAGSNPSYSWASLAEEAGQRRRQLEEESKEEVDIMVNPTREIGAERRMTMKDYALLTIDQEQTLRSNEQRKPSLEETLQSFMMASHDRMERNKKKTDSIKASLKCLEAQMGQIVDELNKEKLSSQPKQANSITTIRRGEVVDNIVMENERNSSSYAGISQLMQKHFEELNTNKRRHANNEKIQVASVMLQYQLPLKMKDPGSFTIDITIGDKKDRKAMLDSGASINLMPYLMYERLGLGELKPTTISLQFANRSIKYPRGIVEDLLVQVGKLIIHVDFVVLDMENTPARDKEQTILLSRSFMATIRTKIDVLDGKLTMTILGDTVEFKAFLSLTLSPKSTIDKCSYNYLDSPIYEQLYDDIPFLIDKSFRDTLSVRVKSMKPYLKGMAYEQEVEYADKRPP